MPEMENGAASAIERIERALARIDSALAATSPAPRAGQSEMAEITARHGLLRDETRRAIAELDALIEAQV